MEKVRKMVGITLPTTLLKKAREKAKREYLSLSGLITELLKKDLEGIDEKEDRYERLIKEA